MTVLVLDIRPPPLGDIHSEADLLRALIHLGPRFVTFLMSFMTLGIFWVGQQTQHDALAHSDRAYTWLHIGFLMAVCVLPFSTALLAEYIEFRTALLVYWFNILLLGVFLLAGWYRAKRVRPHPSRRAAQCRRSLRAARADRAGALCPRRGALRVLDLVEHRGDLRGPAQLRHRPALLAVQPGVTAPPDARIAAVPTILLLWCGAPPRDRRDPRSGIRAGRAAIVRHVQQDRERDDPPVPRASR